MSAQGSRLSNIEHDEDDCPHCGSVKAGCCVEIDRLNAEIIRLHSLGAVKVVADPLREQLRGAVALAREAADLLDELTVYWETQDLPPEVQDTFDDVRRRLTADGGQ